MSLEGELEHTLISLNAILYQVLKDQKIIEVHPYYKELVFQDVFR